MTTPIDDCAKLDVGDIRFYDNYVPTLGAGDYLINVTQEVKPVNTSPAIDDCYAVSQAFSVQGPRYTLPPEDVFSVFPPDNAVGVFHQFLPHVVLAQRELPWERNVFKDQDSTTQRPWLALLLFAEDEQIDGQPALLPPQVANWQPNRSMSATITAASFFPNPSGNGILWPDLVQEWYETGDLLQNTRCTVIDVSSQAFATLIPSPDDLRYLAHVRRVDPSAKDNDVLKVTGDGWYSVLVGSRLPDAPPASSGQSSNGQSSGGKPGRRNIAHLVSLEGLTQYLTGTPLPAGTTRVRLISFKSWSFTCLPDQGESFSQLKNGLLTDAQGQPKQTAFTLPVDPPLGEDPDLLYAYQAIQNGYVPLRYDTRLGEQTFAWYRGPFSPVPVTSFIAAEHEGKADPSGWKPFGTASAAMIYDKTYGVFDASYGVAWESGRLLALANGVIGQDLLDWQRRGHALIDLLLERKSQVAALKSFDPANPDLSTEQSLLQQLQPYAVTGDFMTYLISQFSEEIAPKLYAPAPTPPDQPLPAYPDLPSPPPSPQTIADLLEDADVQEAIRALGGQELDTITNWLAQLYLLIGVPFETLAPAASLLPPESVRFFYLDPNWQAALLEGALSIGIESSRDQFYQDLMKDLIWNTTLEAVQQVRDNLLSAEANRAPAGAKVPFDQLALSGMLLRSAVVSGWPGLQVIGYAETQAGSSEPNLDTRLGLLRLERLSDDVLLCLWPTVPAVVTVDEPHEGIAFGFEDPPAGEGYALYPRSLGASDYGTPLANVPPIDAVTSGIVDPQYRRVKITAAGGLVPTLQAALPNRPAVNVRDFAVEMIKVPERAVFAAQPNGQSSGQPTDQPTSVA